MASIKKINPLQRDGTSQKMRMPAALDPGYAKIDEKSISDLLAFAQEYAKQINFFGDDNTPDGLWDWFTNYDIDEIIKTLSTRNDFEPSLGLFLCFLQLMNYARTDLNTLTQKHLDFYYKQILQLKEKDEVPDKVHVIFELAKNAAEQLITKDSLLDAGKDSAGKKLQYTLTDDIIVNKAQVSSLCNVFVEPTTQKIYNAIIANSADGKGAKLNAANPKWSLFGNNSYDETQIGFAFASPVLLLNEGERNITVTINPPLTLTSNNSLINVFQIYLSGEENWLGPYNCTASIISLNQLSFSFKIPKTEKAIANYNAEKLLENYQTVFPVVRILVNTEAGLPYSDLLKNIVIQSIQINVEVNGVTSLAIENDFGNVDPKKIFMPFGSQPAIGNNLFISYDELKLKNINNAAFHLVWQNVPANFPGKNYGMTLSANQGTVQAKQQVNMFNPDNAANENTITFDFNTVKTRPPYNWNDLQKARINQTASKQVSKSPRLLMTSDAALAKAIQDARVFADIDKGYFRFMLNSNFGHAEFPVNFAKAMIAYQTSNNVTIPSQPYTPAIQSITFDYTASSSSKFTTAGFNDYIQKDIGFFHVGVFGEAEQHPYLKNNVGFNTNTAIYLLPQYNNEGELYIGLTNAEPLSTINILFQLAEGSANPDKAKQTIQWSVLCSDEWQVLTSDYLLADNTNGLLTSGIIKIYLPEQTTGDNTILPMGFTWIKASVTNNTDAVCNAIDILAQAALAVYKNNNNADDHLNSALAANSISKLVNKIAAVKSITQPYSSFGGAAKETDNAFYTRVSERLRHKSRAISINDYERMVLQQFPSLYKVKCLNHTDTGSELSPGNISIVIIPSLQNQNAVNRLQPKADLNTISLVQDFLDDANSFFVKPFVQNPEYEEVRLELDVQFYKNFEFGYYKKVLNEDIVRFLSPWAYDSNVDIPFGGKIYKSILVDFIDGLSYVDFVTNVKLYQLISAASQLHDTNLAIASNSSAILVSAAQHTINLYNETSCS